MEKVVNNALKMDLHIHSKKSDFKDGNIVEHNTIENLNVLIEKLNQYSVNICAIADHDSFDYALYEKLKKQENKGSIKKVFPAVEFSVLFTKNQKKPVHVICVFNDANNKKIKKIEDILKFKEETKSPNYDCEGAFSENKFIDILSEIDLDVVLIAHQKQTLTSTSSPKGNDANIVGEEKFNEFITSEYFEAFEFKNRKNQVFNNISKSELKGDILRFITGSDCHDWSVYPKFSKNSNESDFKHTYLKCLPNFKGLALALTDDTRISLEDNFFTYNKKYIQSIDITLNDIYYSIPMSRGINVIIGDNSIGKSLLLHKMTDYYRVDSLSPLNKTVIKGYDRYLKQNNFEINTVILKEEIFNFDTQGEIRKKFDQGKLKEADFFADKYPPDIDITPLKNKLLNEIENVCNSIESKIEYKKQYKKIFNLRLLEKKEQPLNLNLLKCADEVEKEHQKQVVKIIKQISTAIVELDKLSKILINKDENEKVLEFKTYLTDLKIKYEKNKKRLLWKINLINDINTVFDEFIVEKNKIKTAAETELQEYLVNKENFINSQLSLLEKRIELSEINFDIQEESIKDEKQDYLNFSFIKRSNITTINNDYFSDLLNYPFKKKPLTTYDMVDNEETLKDALKDYDESNALEFYKNKLKEKIDDDFKQKSIVNKVNEKGEYVEYSSGLNSQIYFEILSSDRYKSGVYLIDQPEDDVSPKSIKNHLLKNFKDMGRNRQIIMVTHNPQFVVNLDVDNVIIFTKEEDKLKVSSGALEYQDPNTNILEQVATLLDGGVETIRKRWKRYEKDNRN